MSNKLAELTTACEEILQRSKNANKDEIKTNIRSKIIDNNLILTKADKGNTSDILDRKFHLMKMVIMKEN